MTVEITAASRVGEIYGRNRLEMTTIEQLCGLTAQHNEIIKRVGNGSLSPISVKRALQDIIEGATKTPSVVEEVERQLTVWKGFGVAISDEQWDHILQQAEVFEPATDTDQPLVTGGFGYDNPKVVANKLFGAFTPPDGYTKYNYIEDAELRYAPGMKPTGGLRLIHFDQNAYSGLSPEAALKAAKRDKLRLASIEVLEHLVLTPKSGQTWDGKSYYYPNLSGLQLKYGTDWSSVPYLYRWDDSYRKFRFGSHSAVYADGKWSSPVVREC
jgi:hypothetical protein